MSQKVADACALSVYHSGVKGLLAQLAILLLSVAGLTGCDRMVTPSSSQALKDAQRKATDGDFIQAINLYESALDGSAASADIHYQLALLYDDKMNDPLNALHHFKRYLTLAPRGVHATDAKGFMKRDELALITNLSGDSVVTRGEAARLRNENLNLRKEADARAGQARAAGAAEKGGRGTKAAKAAPSPVNAPSTPRSHIVQPGDTLFSLSRQFYNSPDRWKDILAANRTSIDDPERLKVGQALTIP